MSRTYSTDKIKEALKTARGNATTAQQLIIAQALQDPRLLTELVKPHMKGIVAHAVNHVRNEKSAPNIVKSSAKKTGGEAKATATPEKENFGLDLLKSIANGDTAEFGQEAYARPVQKRSASQGHIDAIQAMINKSQNKDS